MQERTLFLHDSGCYGSTFIHHARKQLLVTFKNGVSVFIGVHGRSVMISAKSLRDTGSRRMWECKQNCEIACVVLKKNYKKMVAARTFGFYVYTMLV